MSKFLEMKSKIIDVLKNNKLILSIVIWILWVAFISSLLFFNKEKITHYISQTTSIFEVNGWNFDLGIKKIPYNTKSIDISFSQELDEKSIQKESFTITPEVLWVIKLKDKNTISYELTDKLVVWQDYTITLSKNIASKNQESFENDIVYIVSAVSGAKVVKFLPEKYLQDISKNIAVFFSIPMVPLTDWDSKDTLPCPLEITPKVEWTCKWTTTSVLEFIPKTWFVWATKYDVKISSQPGMNYELESNFTGSFTTPELQINLANTFIPKDSIHLSFNYPVSIDEIKKNLTLSLPDLNSKLPTVPAPIKYKIEPVKKSETSFVIQLESWDFTYSTSYQISIQPGLKSKYGNIPFNNIFMQVVNTTSLVSYIEKYKNIYSDTWALVNTRNIDGLEFLPNKDVFFNINFFEEVALNKDMFIFKNTKTGKNIDFKISYIKMEQEKNGKKETIDNKKSIKLELNEILQNNSSYSLIISKKSNPSLLSDMVYSYTTSPVLAIINYKFIDYSKSCLYVNNSLDKLVNESAYYGDEGYYAWGKKFVTFSNSGILKTFTQWQYIQDWQFEKSLQWLNWAEKNKKLLEKWYCPSAGTGEILYAIETRLNPNASYDMNIKNLEDVYGNILQPDFKKTLKTWDLKESDKYVYISFSNENNVYPKTVPVVVNIQTINTPQILVELCQMDDNGYKNHLTSEIKYDKNYTPECRVKTSKILSTKLNYWKLTNNKFDIEKDIVWEKLSSDYILIKVYGSNNKNSETKIVSNMITRTNMSLLMEKASNKSLVYATDLVNHKEIEDLKLEFYDYRWNIINIKYTFDTNKKVYVVDDSLSNIAYIIAKNDNFSWIILDNDGFSNYDFKYISGQDSSTKDYAYIYADRPIYRQWDEVQIKGLLREFQFDGYKKSPITSWIIKIIADDWSLYRTIDVNIDKNSNFTGSFIIPKDSTLGNFRFQFADNRGKNKEYPQEIYSNGWFSIEQYRKPTFKVQVENPKNDVSLWEKSNFKVTPKYYFGWKMVNTHGTYSILTQNYYFDGKEYGDYQFGIGSNYFDCIYWGYCNYSDNLDSGSTEFKIDENGEYVFDYTFWDTNEDAEKIYSFNFDVTDPDTEKTVSNSISKVLHTTDGYIWLKANYYNSKDKWIYMQVVSLDYEAKIVPNKDIKVEVIKKDYKQVKKLWVDGVFYNEYATEDILENTFNLETDEKWMAKYNAKTKDSGEYELKVSYTGGNGKTFVSSQTVYVAGDDYISWGNDNNTVTDLEADKITYKVGEKAIFTLKSPVNNGKALIVMEKDDGIFDYFVHDIKSFGDKIEVKLTDKHYPNVYLKAYLIGSQPNNPLPVFKRALSVVKVLTDYKKLNISILTDKTNYKPADKMEVTIEVTDINGKMIPNANGSLSIVDESVLALKWNPRKNPYSFFYDMKRYLSVISYSNLKYLVEKLEVKDVSWGEKWWAGDGVKWWETKKPRGNFKDTAFWLSDFKTDGNGKAIIHIPLMPDNLTTWVLEALVSTPEDNKIGVNYETVMTTTEVMIEDNLPRFLGTDDIVIFAPVVYNRTGKDDEFTIKLQASNGRLSAWEKTVSIKNWESAKVEFPFEVKKARDFVSQDISEITITALAKSDTKKSDSIKKMIPIQVGTIAEYTATVGKTNDISFDEKIALGNISKENATLKLNYWGTLFSYLLDGIEYLSQYPYGCAEQRTSAIMPNIYVKKFYDVAGKEFDFKKKMIKKYIDNEVWYKEISVDEAIQNYLIEIKKFQNTDGWFIYWYDTEYTYSDIHLTSYILSSLSEIKLLWYTVDTKVLENANVYLKKEFYKKPTCSEKIWNNCMSLEMKSEILLSLNTANNKDYEVYKMFQTLDISKMNNLARANLISKISNITSMVKMEREKLKKEATEIISKILSNELVFNPKWAFISASYNSRIYNTTTLLEIIGNIGLDQFTDSETITDSMIRFITASKTNNSFGSTYDNSYIIRAITSYLTKTWELKNTDFFARFNLNSEEIETKKINTSNIFETFSKTIEVKNLQNSNIFNIEKEGSGSIYYDLNLKYFVPTKRLKAKDEWFFIEKKYFFLSEYKKVEALKAQEYEKYLTWEILYENLKYPHEVVEYLTPIKKWNIWDLVLVYNKLVTSEARDQVAIESYIPSWSEIVNTNLATETKTVTDLATNIYLDRKELRDDMYFAWTRELQPGIYNFSYTIRLTHSGNYKVKPTQVSEFYTPEVFGRSNGEEFVIE